MQDFQSRIKLDSSQRAEVQRYLNSISVLSEETILKIVRKLKEIERILDERKYPS